MIVDKDDIKYYLFTNCNKEVGTKLKHIESEEYAIDPQYPVKILIHGWMDDVKSFWYKPTVDEYLKKGGMNVITVNWGKHAKGLFSKVVRTCKSVGENISDFITQVSNRYDVPYKNFHVIGHSLGAHVAGFTGKKIIEDKGQKIGRITGLDPTGPAYGDSGPDDRLCSSDAVFVDVIHTDAGVLGYAKSIGHVDFYPNGGKRKQNGCSSLDLGCSHKRAPLYFCESINSDDFVAIQANNYVEFDCGRCAENQRAVMGENVNRTLRGDFYLHTNKTPPFAKGGPRII